MSVWTLIRGACPKNLSYTPVDNDVREPLQKPPGVSPVVAQLNRMMKWHPYNDKSSSEWMKLALETYIISKILLYTLESYSSNH